MLCFEPFQNVDDVTRGVVRGQGGTSRRPLFLPAGLRKVGDYYVLTAGGPGFGGRHR